jgi:GDP-L-fucose synthase
MSKSKVIVTGSSGVLGAGLANIAHLYEDRYDFLFSNSKICDLRNAEDTLRFIEEEAPDGIIHLAALSGGIGLSMKHHATMLRDINYMTFSLLEAARKCHVKKTIMTLTTGMYPPNAPLPLSEDCMHDGPPHDSNYGSSFAKRLIDPAIRAYREEYDLNVVGLIPNGIFGENDNFDYKESTMVAALIRRFWEAREGNDEIVVWGNGKPLREYTYSQDLAKIYMWVLENYNDPQCLNIGSVEENSVGEIAFMVADCMGIDRARIVFDTSKPEGVFKKSTDNSRFVKLSGFKYTPFREALEKSVKWFIQEYENNPEGIKLKGKIN